MRSRIHHHSDWNCNTDDAPNRNLICPLATTVSMAIPSMDMLLNLRSILFFLFSYDWMSFLVSILHLTENQKRNVVGTPFLVILSWVDELDFFFFFYLILIHFCFVWLPIVLQRCAIYGGIDWARPSKMNGIKSRKQPPFKSPTTTPSKRLVM